jgi:starch synthase
MVASEAQPFSKTGGLADVSRALSRALGRLGHDVTLFTPRYRGVQRGEPRGNVRAFVADQWYDAELQEVPLGPGARAMLVDCGPLYNRGGIYSEHRWDYPDNAARFAFLSIAASEWMASQAQKPDVLHGHDWQAGLLPVYARKTPSVFTIHNIAYQGIVEKEWVPRLGLRWEDFHVNGFEFWDRLSLLKAGVQFAHVLTTVSPTYADEIQRPEYGYGFDGVMRSRSDALVGILNGIDVDEWNPARDPYLPAPYDAKQLEGKREAKRALLQLFGLPADDAAMAKPIIGMVSRMVHQKGLDLIAAVAPHLPSLDATFTIVGTGDQRFEDMWRALAAAMPERFGVHIGFDERRAHLVEAGADAFLMPSRYEPCGLNQMYSMRYGTVPIVRAVGGLVDTVHPYDPATGQGTGFLFGDYDPWALFAALRRALDTYRHEGAWRRLQLNGMTRDFSWERSAAEYVTVYKRVILARQNS